LTFILYFALSFASALVRPATPLLLAVYDGTLIPPWNESMDAIFIIFPPVPCLMNCLAAAWQKKNTVFKLIAITSSQSFSVKSIASHLLIIPALFTKMSSLPNS